MNDTNIPTAYKHVHTHMLDELSLAQAIIKLNCSEISNVRIWLLKRNQTLNGSRIVADSYLLFLNA